MANLIISQAAAQPVVVYDINPEPTILYANGSASTSGVSQIVAAPGENYRIVVWLFILQSEADGQVTAQLRSGTNVLIRVSMGNINDGISSILPKDARIKLNENEALNINLSAAIAVGYTIQYYIEAV